MTDNILKFKHNNQEYEVESKYIDSFAKDFPDAITLQNVNGQDYEVFARDYKSFQEEFFPKTPAVKEEAEAQAPATPVNEELIGQERINAFAKQMELQAGMNKFKSNIDKDLNAFEVASKQNAFNPTVQKVGDEYVDALGNRHSSEIEAIKTNQDLSKMYAQRPNTSLRGRRHEIENTIENSNKEYEKQLSEIEKQITDRQNIVREEHSKKINASTDKFKSYRETQPDFSSDAKLNELYDLKNNLYKAHKVELHNLEQALERLNRQVDKIEGNEAGFWQGALDKVTDSRTWDFGLQDLDEALIQNNFNENYNNLSQQEKEGVNKMLEAIYRNQFLSQEYQDSKMYGYGEMLGVMPSFAVDLFTGAGLIGGGIKVGTKAGVKLATKAVGKEVAEEIAEKGTLKYIQNNGLKGARDIASQNFIKFLGQSADDIAKASIVTAVPQGMKTGAGIIDRKLGNVVEDEQGNLKFEDEKSWNNAIYNEVTDRVVEAFSEMFGGHLGKVTLKGVGELADAVGAKKIGSALLTADAKMLDGSLKKIKDAFSKVGINDLSGEALEEYYGQLWRTVLNQEDAYITNPDGSKTNLLAVKDFHVDLVVGLGLTMGAMKSVQYPFTVIDYIYTKNKVRKAGNKASVEVGAEKWKEIKQLIDNATNQDVSKIVADVFLKENISGKGKLAVLDYVAKTAFLRGYNIGELSQNIEQDLSEVDKTIAERKRRENENYLIGYNATGEQKVDIKDRYEASRQRLEELGISTDNTEDYSDLYALAEKLQGNGESAKANAVYSFINSDTQYNGLIEASKDDIDIEVESNNNTIDSRINPDTNKIIKAKNIQGEEVYIIKGNIRVNEQGEAEIIGGDSVVIQKADGTQEMVSPTDLAEFEEIEPEQLKEESNATIKQTLLQQKADEIEGVVPLQVGMQVQGLGVISAIDEQGNVAIQIEGKEEPAIIPYNSVQALLQQARVDAIKQEQAQEEQTPQQISAEDIGLGYTAEVNGETLEVVGIYEDKFMVDYQGKTIPMTKEEIAEIVNNAQPTEQPAEEVAETKENNTENNTEKNAPNEKIIGQNTDNQGVEIRKSIGNEVSKKDADYLNLSDVDAWNTLVAECNGDVETATEIVNETIEDAEKTLQKIKNAKLKRGNSVAEKIAIRNEHQQNIANAEAVLEKWKAIANVPNMQPVAEETTPAIEEVVATDVAEIPDITEDKPQDARNRGFRRVNGQRVDRQSKLDVKKGKETNVRFAENVTQQGNYAVVEASDLQPSHINGQRNPLHFIEEAQPKERTDNASTESAKRIAENIRPEEITTTTTAYVGTPTINERGEVIQGNNRGIALRTMYAGYKDSAQKYKQYLIDHAEEFGLNPADIEAMESPVLVNMLAVEDKKAIELGQYVAQDTESGGVERIKPKNVVQKMGEKIKNFANILFRSSDEDSSLAELIDQNGAEVLNWLAKNNFITDTQYQSAFDSKGNLTAEAKNDLRNVLYNSLFKNAPSRLEEMFNNLPAKAQKGILATAFRDFDSPNSEKMLTEIQQSIIAYNYLLNDANFVNAKTYTSIREAIEGWRKQTQFDDATGESFLPAEKFSNFALHLVGLYKGQTQKYVQNVFNELYDLIQGTKADNLFETNDKTKRTLAEAIKEVLDIDYKPIQKTKQNGRNGSNVLGNDTQNGEERGRGSSETVERGESNEDRQGTDDSARGIRGDNEEVAEVTEEVDENGYPFVVSTNGTTTFGEITDDTGLTPAPIKLSVGFNKVDERGNNIGYGLLHIEAGHGEQIKKAGYSSIESFVEDVTRNYKEIRIAKDRKSNQTYMLLELHDEKHKRTLYIELSKDGDYWTVNSGGIFRNKYTDKNDIVLPIPTIRNNANTDTVEVVGSPTEVAKGETADRGGNSSKTLSSDSKDTTNSKKVNSLEQENATNLENEEVVEEENPVKQRLQELKKEYASETNMFERVKLEDEVIDIIKNEFGVTIPFVKVGTLLGASEEDFAYLLSEIEKGNNPIKAFEQRKESLSKLSKEENARRQPLRKRAKEWEEKVGAKVRIIESVDEVRNQKARQAIKAGRNVTGWYNVAQNEVYIYLPNITSEKEIDNTYLHEVVAHKGLRELLGQKKFDALCNRVWNSMSKEAQEEYAEYVGARENPTQKEQRAAADEYMAYLAEKTNLTEEEKNIWNKLVDWVKEVLSDIFNTKLTDEQIQDLIRASYQNLMTTSNNQENLDDNEYRFRENKNELVAVHNITEEDLRKVFEIGGLIMPSITKADIGHSGYGEISLLFDKNTIDPADRRNKVFGGDAWTPRFPRMVPKLNDNVIRSVRDKISKLLLNDEIRQYYSLSAELYPNNIEKVIADYGVAGYYNKEWLKIAYLLDKGMKFKIPTKDKDYGEVAENLIRLAKEKGLSLKDIQQEGYNFYENNPDFVADVEEAGIEKKLERISEKDREKVRELLLKKPMGFNAFDNHVNKAIQLENDLANGGKKQIIDSSVIGESINKKVKTDNVDYNKWVDNLFEGIVEKYGIRNNRDWYTPSGNRRSWEQLYDDVTPENILRYMLAQNEQGGSGNLWDSNIMGASADTYESIEEIREKGKERLRKVDATEYEEWASSVTDRITEICDEFLTEEQKNRFGGFIDAKISITNAVAKDKTAKGIYKKMKIDYPNFTMEHAKSLVNIVKEIQDYTIGYFEAKPQRIVSLSEVRKAIVPSNVSSDVLEKFNENGIDVATYRKGNEQSRQRLIKKESNDIRFRVTEEEKQIIDNAKANGTYMKAPNGKASNLNAKQWVQVRTQAFKNWFGDWEKAFRIEKLRKSKPIIVNWNDYKGLYELNKHSAERYILDNLRGEYINEDTNEKIKISRKSTKVTHHDATEEIHLKSIALIPQMIQKAIFIEELNSEKANNKFDSYRYYVVGLKVDDVDYTAKLVVGVKGLEIYYDHALTQIEKSDIISQRDLVNAQVYDDNITLSDGKDKRLFSILQINSSKIVNENGEPLVVYHGSDRRFYTFKKGDLGFHFGTQEQANIVAKEKARESSRRREIVNEYFLNIRNPFRIDYDPETWEDVGSRFLSQLKKDGIITEKQFEKLGWYGNSYAKLRPIRNSLQEAGYDGIVYPNWFEFEAGEDYRTEFDNSYITLSPNQIKSATDNVGTFSSEEDDIRFRESNENQEIFVSNAEKAVKGIKQEKATPQQWLKMIEKNSGLKAGEDKWLGLSDWLKENKSKSLTKQEVLDFIRENKIIIEEVEYSETNNQFEELKAEYEELVREQGSDYAREVMEERFGDDFFVVFDDLGGELVVNDYEDVSALLGGNKIINSTRLDYTTEGLENKREIALTIPNIESWNEGDEVHFGDAGEGRAVAWVRFGETVAYDVIEDVKEVTEFHKPYKNASGNEVYRPKGNFSDKDFIVYGKARNGEMIYVVYINEKQIPVAHQTLEDAQKAMNEYYKEHPRKLRKPLRVLVIDEIQSKRHQEGREKGYATNGMYNKLNRIEEEMFDANAESMEKERLYREYFKELLSKYGGLNDFSEDENQKMEHLTKDWLEAKNKVSRLREEYDKAVIEASGVPDAPFEKNWHELAMKRMLRYASENGFDKIAWLTGEQQAERYNLSNHIDSISIEKSKEDSSKYNVTAWEGDYPISNIAPDPVTENEIISIFGKELGNKLIEGYNNKNGFYTLENQDLKIGGEGMKGFYDKMLPSFVNKYAKKWGVKVEDVTLPNLAENNTMHSIDITDEMKESVMEGQVMFRELENDYIVTDINGNHIVRNLFNDEETRKYFNQESYNQESINEFNQWLKAHKDDYVRLYHGTGARHNIKEEGLLKTSKRRRNSYQSENGYVYLSIYPQNARLFGELGNPYDNTKVYSVDVKIKELKPDTDQLANKRFYAEDENIGNTLADSLVYGSGARVKRNILPYELNETMFRELENEELINEQFNKELQQQIDGTLPKGHIYQLGLPSEVMLSTGIPNLPIQLNSSKLQDKSTKYGHDYKLEEIKNLVKEINNPLGIFAYGDKSKAQNIIIEIQSNGKNFVVGLSLMPTVNGERLEINSIRNVFPKDNAEWLNWIAQGKSLYLNKEKIQTLINQQRTNLADVEYLDLDSVAKIVQNFENPSFSDNISERQGEKTYTDEELSYENDPIAKVLGKPRYSLSQRKAFAKRQRERMLNHAVGVIEKLHLDNVEIVTDVETLQGKRKKAKGFYNTTTGKITIVMPNHTNIYDVQETILHEAVAHYGLRKLFGEHFDTFLDNVYNNASQEVREQIVELANKNYWDFAKATEEYLASLAETTNFEDAVNTSWWQKIKHLFVKMLRNLGLNDFRGETLTDNELRYILWRSYQNLIDPNAYRNPFAVAEDVVMQDELKVGNYATINEERTKVAEEEVLFREQQEEENSIERYNRKINNGAYQSYEAFADSMASVKTVMEQATGEKVRDIAGYENAYLGENALSSANKAQIDWATEHLFNPLYKVVHSLAKNEQERKELDDYLLAKHGLERNEKMRADVEEANKKATEKTNKINEELKADYVRRIIAGEEVGELKLQKPKLQKTNRDFAGLIGLTGIESVNGAEEKAKQIVEEYEEKFNTKELWEKINAITKATLKKSLDSGIISQETYDKISSMYKYYIPLRGFDETTAEDMFSYLTNQEFGRFTPAFIKARGRRSKADNPFAFMESMYESAVLQGNRNTMVKQRFLNFVNNHPSELFSLSKDLWLQYDVEENTWKPVFPKIEEGDSAEVIKKKTAEFEKEMRQKAKEQPDSYKNASEGNERLPYKFEVKNNKHQHQIIVKQNGKDIVITVNGNPRVAQAINGLTNPDNDLTGALGALLGGAQNLNRYLSTMYTSASLDFVVRNFIRDLFYSNFMVWVRENPKYALRFNGNYLRFFFENLGRFLIGKNLFRKWRKGTLNRDNEVERLFEEFMLNGGETGYVELKNIEEHKKEIAKKIKKSKDVRKMIMYQLASINRVIENNARFAAYYTSRNMGRDIARSVYDAKEISVNFNKKGAGSKFLNATGQTALGKASAFTSGAGRSLYIFWNPAIQGLAQFLRAYREHPIKSSVLTATAIGAGMFIAWLLSGDDEEEEKYYNIPERIRRQNLIIPIGENYLALPLPIEFRVFYGLGELLYSVTSGKEYMTSGELAWNIAEQFSQVLPINFLEGESPLMQLVPSAIRPIVEVGRNESWTGLPIYKDDSFGGIVEGHKPEYQNVYKNANPTLVMASKQINDWTGGDDVKEGSVDINPAIVEHLAKGYLGGIFNLANDITNSIYTILGDREFDVRDIPAVGAVIAKADERTQYRAVNNRYYEAKKEADEMKYLKKGYEKEIDEGNKEYNKVLEELKKTPEYKRFEIFEARRKGIDKLSRKLKKATEDNNEERMKELNTKLYQKKKEMLNKWRKVNENK